MNRHVLSRSVALTPLVCLPLLAVGTAFGQAHNYFMLPGSPSARAAAQKPKPANPPLALQEDTTPKEDEQPDSFGLLDLPREPYMLRRGLYVFPEPYSPDYFSPLMRRFPDYSDPRGRYLSRDSYYAPLFAGGPRDDNACGSPDAYYPYPGAYYPPPAYGYGYSPYGSNYDAYEQGRYDADHEYAWYIATQRAGMLLNQYRDLFEEGIICFRNGQYDWAVIKQLGAAEKNQASGTCRLQAGHALFALGRYDDAAKMVVRAFELSPSLWGKRYDLRDEYGNKADFDKHLAALKTYAQSHPDSANALTLLGYVTFYSEGPGAAYPYLKRAAQLDPRSYFLPRLLGLSYAASGMPAAPAEPAPQAQPAAARSAPAATVAPHREIGKTKPSPRGNSTKTKATPARPSAVAKDRPMAV